MTLASGCTQNKDITPSVNPTKTPHISPEPTYTLSDNSGGEVGEGYCESFGLDATGHASLQGCSNYGAKVLFGSMDNVNGGDGYLTIANRADNEAVAVLTYTGKKEPVFSAFIPIDQGMRLSGISAEVTYDFYYMLGNSWNSKLKKFGTVTSYKRYTDPLVFKKTFADRTHTVSIAVRLSSGVADEWRPYLKISDIGANDFPQIVL